MEDLLDFTDLTYVSKVFRTGDCVAVLVHKDASEDEFDEIHETLWNNGITEGTEILIINEASVGGSDPVSIKCGFIMTEGTRVYEIAS